MLKVAVLVSGGGTNLQAVLDAIDAGRITNAGVCGVISNNKNAMPETVRKITVYRHSAFLRRIMRQEKSLTRSFWRQWMP